MTLICFQHPSYKGTTGPVLSCKTCCSLFVQHLKHQSAMEQAHAKTAAAATNAAAMDMAKAAPANHNFGFNPQMI